MARFYDTYIAEYLKMPWSRWLSLDALSEKCFDYEMISYNDVTNKWKINFRDVPLDVASDYSAEDVVITHQLYSKQLKEWQNSSIFDDIEMPLLQVLKSMELSWVKIDVSKLTSIWEWLIKENTKIEREIYLLAWEEFNISSPKQVAWIFFEKLEMPSWKKTKTWYSVDTEVLENLAFTYPIARLVLTYRQNMKLLSTYIEWVIPLINDRTNRIHTTYNQAVTATWRLSSSKPNLQNIPIWEWVSWEIRSAFIPYSEDDLLVAFDYSQVEIRILAIMSKDPLLIKAFNNGEDIHRNTAEFLFNTKDITSEQRKKAKSVNFWVIYWISPFWLSKITWVSQKEAKQYIDTFFEKYQNVKIFFDKIISNCHENWYVETLFWRRRYIKWINDRNATFMKAAEREAINMPVQWTSADIIKLSMIKVHEFIKMKQLKSRMIMQVHDELVFNVLKDELDILLEWVQWIMEGIIDESVNLKVDFWVGKNWKEAK